MIVDELELDATPEGIRRCREMVERACAAVGATEDQGFALKLAVDEAVSNVVEHAFAGREDGRFRVRFEADSEMLRVLVTHQGMSYDPTHAPRPDLSASWQERTVGGLGFHLMRAVLDEMSYSSDATGNHLVLGKRRNAPAGAPAAGRREG